MESMGTKPVTPTFVRLHILPIRRKRRTYWKNCRRHQMVPRTIHLLQFRHRPEGEGYLGPCTHSITLCWATGLSGPHILHARIPPVHDGPQQHAAVHSGLPPKYWPRQLLLRFGDLTWTGTHNTICRWGNC